MRAAKVDSNQADYVALWRRGGLLVLSLARLGGGAPDVLLCNPWTRSYALVEIKVGNAKLREKQSSFQGDGWPVRVCRTAEDAEAILCSLDGGLTLQRKRSHS